MSEELDRLASVAVQVERAQQFRQAHDAMQRQHSEMMQTLKQRQQDELVHFLGKMDHAGMQLLQKLQALQLHKLATFNRVQEFQLRWDMKLQFTIHAAKDAMEALTHKKKEALQADLNLQHATQEVNKWLARVKYAQDHVKDTRLEINEAEKRFAQTLKLFNESTQVAQQTLLKEQIQRAQQMLNEARQANQEAIDQVQQTTSAHDEALQELNRSEQLASEKKKQVLQTQGVVNNFMKIQYEIQQRQKEHTIEHARLKQQVQNAVTNAHEAMAYHQSRLAAERALKRCTWESCDYTCTSERGIRDHMQNKHGVWAGKHVAPKANDCPFCKAPHQSSVAMKRHIEKEHGKAAAQLTYDEEKKLKLCPTCKNRRCRCMGAGADKDSGDDEE